MSTYTDLRMDTRKVRAALDMTEPQVQALWFEMLRYRREKRWQLAVRCLNWLRFIKAIKAEWNARQLELF